MLAEARKDLSRRLFVAGRRASTAAASLAYVAARRALAGPRPKLSREAQQSLDRRLRALFEDDWSDAQAGYYPQSLIGGLPWREYVDVFPKLLLDIPRASRRAA